jgi:hypothetical protein
MNTKKKDLTPVGGKDGKTYWMKMGIAFQNDDGKLSVYLDALPITGKLFITDWEDTASPRGHAQAQLPATTGMPARHESRVDDNLPF